MKQRKRINKYNNRKTVVHGVAHNSLVEGRYHQQLETRKRAGEIKDYECEVTIELQPKYKKSDGSTVRAINYKADFVIVHNDNSTEYVDVKGSKASMTPLFIVKKKMFEYRYKQELKCITWSYAKRCFEVI